MGPPVIFLTLRRETLGGPGENCRCIREAQLERDTPFTSLCLSEAQLAGGDENVTVTEESSHTVLSAGLIFASDRTWSRDHWVQRVPHSS